MGGHRHEETSFTPAPRGRACPDASADAGVFFAHAAGAPALPASLRLTQDEPISLLTGMLRASGEGLEVSASQDETLSQYVSVTGQKSGTSELLLSILGIPLRRVEVEVSPEKRLIPGGRRSALPAGRTAC